MPGRRGFGDEIPSVYLKDPNKIKYGYRAHDAT